MHIADGVIWLCSLRFTRITTTNIEDRCALYTFWCCTTRPFPFFKKKIMLFLYIFFFPWIILSIFFCFLFWLKTVVHYTLLVLHNLSLSFFFFKIIFFIQLTCICSILDRCVSYTFWCCTIVSCCSFTSFLYCTSTTRPFSFWKRKYVLFCFYFCSFPAHEKNVWNGSKWGQELFSY